VSQSAAGLLRLIQEHKLRFFRTGDVVTLSGLTTSAAAKALDRLATQGLLQKMKRGLWVRKNLEGLNPFEAVPFLTAPWPSYVSLYSALAHHGIVEEIPHVIYAVSAGRPSPMKTPLGQFFIHHLPAHLIWGFAMQREGSASYPLIPRSPLGFPYKRDKRWKLNLTTLARYARRFEHAALIKFLKNNHLWKPI
jgi:hypothetical protein